MNKHWPLNKAQVWERAPFLRLLLPLIMGIVLYPDGLVAQSITLYVGLFVVVVSGYTVNALSRKKIFPSFVSFVLLHVAVIVGGWLLCYYHDVRHHSDWYGHAAKDANSLVVRVDAQPAERAKTWKVNIAVTHVVKDSITIPVTGDAILYLSKYKAPAVQEGDLLVIPAKVQQITNRGNPYEFDYAGYMERNNVLHTIYARPNEVVVYMRADDASLSVIRRIHHYCIRQLEWYIQDRETLGLLKAMLMNDTDMLDRELSDAYAATGIVHVIAISGGHISIFFVLVAALLIWVRNRKYHWVKYMVAIPLVWLYVVVAGAPPSAVRAATMFSILGVGFALQKVPNGINQLLATAFFVLCANPMWLYDIGFQLSFVAVLSILLFYRPIYHLWAPVNKVQYLVWSAVVVSIAAEVLVAPLVVYYFHLFPLQFIVANVLAYLFMGIVLIAGMLLIAIAPVHTLAQPLGNGITYMSKMFNKLVYALQEFNPDSFSKLTLTAWQLCLVYVVICSVAIFLIQKKKPALFVALIATCIWIGNSIVQYWNTLNRQMIVVYNAGDRPYIELISGQTAHVLRSTDSIDANLVKYAIEPAHVNLHINGVVHQKEQRNLYAIGDKTVLLLDKPLADTSFHADVLVLCYQANDEQIGRLKRLFTPKVIVRAVSRGRVGEHSLIERLHDVAVQGAYMIYSN